MRIKNKIFCLILFVLYNQVNANSKNDTILLLKDLISVDFKEFDCNHFSKVFGKKNILSPKLIQWDSLDLDAIEKIFQIDLEISNLSSLNYYSQYSEEVLFRKKFKSLKKNNVLVSYTLPYKISDTNYYIFMKLKEFVGVREKSYSKEFCIYQRYGTEWINIISVNDFILD